MLSVSIGLKVITFSEAYSGLSQGFSNFNVLQPKAGFQVHLWFAMAVGTNVY
jgi:hypothetical protein